MRKEEKKSSRVNDNFGKIIFKKGE